MFNFFKHLYQHIDNITQITKYHFLLYKIVCYLDMLP